LNPAWKMLAWSVGGTAVIFGGATLLNRAEAKRKRRFKPPPEPTAGATVRWTRGLYTAAVHRSAAPAGEEPAFTWGAWLTSDVLAAGNSLDAASAAGKKLIDGPADDYKTAVTAVNGWIDSMKGKPPKEFPKPPTPTPEVPPTEPTQPDPGQIGWYTRGPFTIVTWLEEAPADANNPWSWAVFRSLQVVLYNQDWARLFDEKLDVARGPADTWFGARTEANAWVDGQLQGEAVTSPAKPDEVVPYPPSFHAEIAKLPKELMPPNDGLVELASKAGDCGAILVGPDFWDRAGNVANWLWDNGLHELRKIQDAILDEFTHKCRTADTPAARSFRTELAQHLVELKAYKEK
jgi:hypothetical protein